jgi:hypothetical protein
MADKSNITGDFDGSMTDIFNADIGFSCTLN